MAEGLETDTRALLTQVLSGAKRHDWRAGPDEPAHFFVFNEPDGARVIVAFEGQARINFASAARSLAGHALSMEGMTPRRIEGLIAQAAWRAHSVGVEEALDRLEVVCV